ncbi:MAG: hypothetical protein KKH94_00260 [Candidatus Omnitrophica bacterium]|nr:hypothetical protein [Candidatus Omnitrophota bacterium]
MIRKSGDPKDTWHFFNVKDAFDKKERLNQCKRLKELLFPYCGSKSSFLMMASVMKCNDITDMPELIPYNTKYCIGIAYLKETWGG